MTEKITENYWSTIWIFIPSNMKYQSLLFSVTGMRAWIWFWNRSLFWVENIRFGNQNRKWKVADPLNFNVNEGTRILLLSAAKARGIQLMKEVRKNCHIVRSNSTSSGNKDATDTASTVNNVRFYLFWWSSDIVRRPQNLKKNIPLF